MRAVVVGAVESTRVTLRALQASPAWHTAALITLPPELPSRHSDYVDLSAEASAARARMIFAADSNAPDILRELVELAPDHVFVVGWSQLCKPAFLKVAGRGAIGYHPAALPRLRGRAVIPWTILLDEKITGSSLFWIDEGVDSGPLLGQRFLHVAPDETAQTLYDRHLAALASLLEEALPALAQGAAPRLAQDERYATYCAKRTADDGLIDWHRPVAEVWRLVRAVGRPYPGAFTQWRERRLRVWQAHPASQARSRLAAMPGQVTGVNADAFAVRCGDGQDLWVEVFEWEGGGRERPPALHAKLGS